MKTIPRAKNAVVQRADFSDDAAWDDLCAVMLEPTPRDGFRANLDFVSDRAFEGATVKDVLGHLPEGANRDFMFTFIFIVDRIALSNPEHPVLVVDLHDQPGRTFRVIPSEMWGAENNLSIANMDFADFAESADADGVFRGFNET
jgi:hypothetical protein